MRILLDRHLSLDVWKLAGPVVIGMLSQTLLNVVDTAMVGRLGAVALGAVGLGGILSWMVLGTVGQLNVGAQAVAARRFGEGRKEETGRVFDNALLLALVIGSFVSLAVARLMSYLYPLFTDDPAVQELGSEYVLYRLYGGLPFLIIFVLRGFFNGVGQTTLHMRVAILVNITNIILNYLLIFGGFGFPRLETKGAAIASALATTIGAVYFLGISLAPRWRLQFRMYHRHNISRDIMANVVRLAVPSGLQAFLVMLGFSLFTSIVARVGTIELAATQVCISVMSLSYLPGAGIGTAASTLIGQKLGEGVPDRAEAYGWEAGRLGMYLMGSVGLLFMFAPELIFRLFTNDPEVIAMGLLPLRIVGAVQVFDGAGMVFTYALYGAGMNRWVFIAEVIINWLIFLPLTFALAIVFELGMVGAWIAFAAYMTIYGVTVGSKYYQGSWKEAKV